MTADDDYDSAEEEKERTRGDALGFRGSLMVTFSSGPSPRPLLPCPGDL